MDEYFAQLNRRLIKEYNDVTGTVNLANGAPTEDKPILRDMAIEEAEHAEVIKDILTEHNKLEKTSDYEEAKEKAEKALESI